MSDFVDGLEQDLVAAARRRATAGSERRRRWPTSSLRTIVLVLGITVGAASAAAAATLYTLHGSVIPAPAAVDVPPSQTLVPDTVRVSPLRIADPESGVAPWTIRVGRSSTGYVCSTVGQVVDGRFGLIGMDGRFRELAPGATDSCGQERKNAATLVGARVLAAKRSRDVRTVISGVAGDTLRRVQLRTSHGVSDVRRADGGTFVAVFAGYPEDVAAEVTLTFADGHRQIEPLGVDPSVVLDPEDGPAWKAQSWGTGGDARQCTTFAYARPGQSRRMPSAPSVCGLLQDPRGDGRVRKGFFLAVRRLSSASVRRSPGELLSGSWRGAPARTAVWGGVGEDVEAVEVFGPGVPTRSVLHPVFRTILGVFPASVRPESLTIRVTMKDGTVRTVQGDTNLVSHPVRMAQRRPRTVTGRSRP